MAFFQDRKVLVTGGTGFVGINLMRRLLPLGAQIRATMHRKDPVIQDPRIEYVRCDLTQNADCLAVVQDIEYVFHCAANTSGAAVMTSTPLVHVTPNIVMNAQLLEAAYHAQVRKFLWIGSSTGYPPTGNRPAKEEEMFDGNPEEKYFLVGWMKRYTEILCRCYAEKLKNPMTTVVLRPTNIYGDNDDFDFATSHVFAAQIRKVVERHDPIEIWGDGEDVRDVIYVDDFVDAMLLAIEQITSYNPLNIGYGKGFTVKELLLLMLAADGYPQANIVYNPAKPTMAPVKLVDTAKAENVLGFKAKTDLQAGIRKTLTWYREHRD